jgi:hypothetical protein
MMLQMLNREPELERHRSFRLAAKRCPMAAGAKQSLAHRHCCACSLRAKRSNPFFLVAAMESSLRSQ